MLLTLDRLEKELNDLPGHIGFFCRDLATGETLQMNEKDPIEAASVIKLAVMAEAFGQSETGITSLDELITIHAEDKLPSCGALSYLHDGLTLPLNDLVTLMIILSDNTATNLLIDRLGASNIKRTMSALGLDGFCLRRKLFMPELARQGIRNTVTAAHCAKLLEMIVKGKLISENASKRMLDILGNQRLNGKMPFYLHDKGIRCAHKTGEDDGITHDVGIIFAQTPRIFCFLSEFTNVPKAEIHLQRLAALCADVEVE